MRNAYIVIAMDGTPLIQSGKKAFNLLLKNLIEVVVLNRVGDFVLFLGRVFVTLISGFVCYELIGVSFMLSFKYFKNFNLFLI
jgi:solute carrier family 44 (choline transporter-like protein), member 2/4/5